MVLRPRQAGDGVPGGRWHVADDATSVRRLFDLLSAAPDEPYLYDALFEVAHRAKVRVMPGGQLVKRNG